MSGYSHHSGREGENHVYWRSRLPVIRYRHEVERRLLLQRQSISKGPHEVSNPLPGYGERA